MAPDFMAAVARAVEVSRTHAIPPLEEQPILLGFAEHVASLQLANMGGITIEGLWAPHPVVIVHTVDLDIVESQAAAWSA